MPTIQIYTLFKNHILKSEIFIRKNDVTELIKKMSGIFFKMPESESVIFMYDNITSDFTTNEISIGIKYNTVNYYPRQVGNSILNVVNTSKKEKRFTRLKITKMYF